MGGGAASVEDRRVLLPVALVETRLIPREAAVKRDTGLELESGGASGELVAAGGDPDFIAGLGLPERVLNAVLTTR
jgi:hypothetical protein